MKHLIQSAALLGTIALFGCGEAPDAAPDQCGASTLQWLLGQPEAALDGLLLPENHRVLHPDSIVTLDFSLDRLNIHVSENGVIISMRCG